MKKIAILLLLAVFIVGCQTTFDTTFNQIEKLSKKYDTSFKTEQLNTTSIASLKSIAPLIGEIEKVQAGDKAAEDFKEARINMLKSQLYWHLALGVGPAGFASDGFRCNDHKEMVKTSEYLNKSLYYGQKAHLQLDELLAQYPEHRDLIGISDTKTAFYFSPLDWITNQIRFNEQFFKTYCLDPFKPKKNETDDKITVPVDEITDEDWAKKLIEE